MKVEIADGKSAEIKGRTALEGDIVTVKKDFGERLISEGTANRIIDEPENRVRVEAAVETPGVLRYSGHRKIFQGSDGKKYERQGSDYVEIEE